MSIVDRLKEKRPNLSASSIKTYNSILTNLYKKIYLDDKTTDVNKFNNPKQFINNLKDVEPSKRKNILSALVVLTDNEDYKKLLIDDSNKYKKLIDENIKSETQKANWINHEELINIFNKYKLDGEKLLKQKEKLNNQQLQTLQNYIILCLTAGIYIPPRRSLDWTLLKHKNFNKDKDNYYNKKDFVFNQYKTAKFYNQQNIEVPLVLKRIINKWIKLIDNDFILFDINNKPLTPVKLNQRLNKIFGKKISVNILRHSYLSNKYKMMPKLKDMKETAESMGHSLEEALQYVKK